MVQTRVLFLLLLSLLLVFEAKVSQGQKHDCQRLGKLDYCTGNNSRLSVTKRKQDYTLRLCSGNECMSDIAGDANLRIRCKDVCDVCKALPGQNGKP